MNLRTGVAADAPGSIQSATGLLDEAHVNASKGRLESVMRFASKTTRRVLSHSPAMPISGFALFHADQAQRSIAELVTASQQAPSDAELRCNLAMMLERVGRLDAAMVEYAACLAIDPDHDEALWRYGELLRGREFFGKALECWKRLRKIEGGLRRENMAHRMAICCDRLGRDAEAAALFEDQLASNDLPATHWEYAQHLLARGQFDKAWVHYAHRFDAGAPMQRYRPNLPYPWWDGQYQPDTTLLVVGEQGASDDILFSSFLPDLALRAREAAMRVVIACRTSLIRLFKASFPSVMFVEHEVGKPVTLGCVSKPSRVARVMIGDLPLWMPKPLPTAYLRPADEDVRYLRGLMAKRDGPRIGLAWSTNPFSNRPDRQLRNVNTAILNARLHALQQAHPDAQLYSLLDEPHRETLAQFADVRVIDMAEHLMDFSRTAALMKELDVIVTVCTSTANLAGALGCDTRVLLKTHADWRWHRDTAWYPNTITYPQKIPTDWSDPIERLCRELQDTVCDRRSGEKN